MNKDIVMRRVLLSGAGLVSMALAMTVSGGALAQKGSILKPVTDWSVTKMAGASGAYCTMARRFQYNAILTIAQNQKAESTFALDFQRPILKSRDALQVVLDPGAGQQRTFSVSPISNQAFVTRLGYDPNFFTALKSTGYLRVVVDGQSYNFNLSDIDDGRFKLNGCVSALMPEIQRQELPVASAVTPAPIPSRAVGAPPAQIYKDGDAYAQEIAALRKQVDDMAAHNRDVAAKSAMRAEEIARKAQEPIVREAVPPMPARVVKAEPRVLDVPVPLPVAPRVAVPSVDAQEVNLLAAQVNRLRQDNFKLEQRLAAAQSSANSEIDARSSQHVSQLNELKTKNSMLQEELAAVYAQQKSSVANATSQTSARENELLALSAAQKTTMGVLEAEVLSLKEKNRAQAQEIITLAAQSVEVEMLQQQLAALSQEKMSLEQQAANHGGQLDMVASLQKQVMALTTQKASLAGELKVLQHVEVQENVALESLELENQNLKMALAKTKADLAVMAEQKTRTVAQAETSALEAQYAQEISAKTQMIDVLSDENGALKDRLDQVQLLLTSQELTAGNDIVQASAEPAVQVEPVVSEVRPKTFPITDEARNTTRFNPAQREELLMKARMQQEQASIDAQNITPPPIEVREAQGTLEPIDALKMPAVERSQSVYQASLPVPELLRIVSPGSQARLVERNSGPAQVAYQWSSNEVFGSAEQQPLNEAYQFDGKVQEYLERTQQRCPGDFAIVPDDSFEQGGVRVDSYDVACVGAGVSSSAALLFYNDAGTFTAFAHEAPTERLADAIEKREKIVSAVVSGS